MSGIIVNRLISFETLRTLCSDPDPRCAPRSKYIFVKFLNIPIDVHSHNCPMALIIFFYLNKVTTRNVLVTESFFYCSEWVWNLWPTGSQSPALSTRLQSLNLPQLFLKVRGTLWSNMYLLKLKQSAKLFSPGYQWIPRKEKRLTNREMVPLTEWENYTEC